MVKPLFAGLVLALVLALSSRAHAAPSAPSAPSAAAPGSAAPGEAIVEGRLLAPCCYTQTLDVHQSEMATELRNEVRARLRAGETQEAVEEDFVDRYGERVRAVPKGKDPRGKMFMVTMGAMAAAAVAFGLLVRRWRRAPAGAPDGPSLSEDRDVLDDRVDELLRDLDG